MEASRKAERDGRRRRAEEGEEKKKGKDAEKVTDRWKALRRRIKRL